MFVILLLSLTTGVLGIGYRLPVTVIPSHYTLKLVPYFEERNFTFDGEVEITVTAATYTDHIILHYVDMEILEIPTVTSLNRHHCLEVVDTTYDNDTNFYTLKLNTSLVRERDYRIHLKYVANLNGDVLGFYKCVYNRNKEQRWFAVTYFEPAHARKAFPCFDEPALKARFRIKIARLPDYSAISNMPRENSSDPDPNIGGRIWDTFQETPPISTYLVGFMVSDLKNVSSADGRYTIWGVENIIHRANYALSIIPTIVEAMENYTGAKYSLPKLDSIAEPCFRGGMENWGMVVYQEWEILESDYPTVFKDDNVQDIIVHEVSHMWFGNLITPTWWDELWLKEGFARYSEYVISQQLKPDWRKEEQFVVNLLQPTLYIDIQDNQPMRDRIENVMEASIPVSIVYGKAACIIRMMAHFLTHETFNKGVRRYFKAYANSVASADDLFQIMEDQQRDDHVLPDDIDVKSAMDPWTLQGSFPIVNVQRNHGIIQLTQNEFVMEKDSATNGKALWWIPISYTTSANIDFSNTRPKAWMKGEPSTRLPETLTESEWIIINIQVTGFYRVNYDLDTWRLITDYLKSPNFRKIQTVNRAQLLDDAFFLANVSLLNSTVALELSLYLAEETDYIPWASFCTILSHLNEYLLISDIYDSFRVLSQLREYSFGRPKEYSLNCDNTYRILAIANNYGTCETFLLLNYALFLMEKIYQSIDNEVHEDDSYITKLSRFNILYWSCYLGYSECLKWASTQYKAWLSNPENTTLSLDLKGIVLCTTLNYNSDVDWENMWDVFVEHNKSTEILYLLAYFQCTDYYTEIMLKYSNLTISVLDAELEDLDSSGTAIRSGLRTSYMHIFNKELNYTVSVFNNVDRSMEPESANTTIQDARTEGTTEGWTEESDDSGVRYEINRDIINWLRDFETKHKFL